MESSFLCSFWPYLAGALGAWCIGGLLNRHLWNLPIEIAALRSERTNLLARSSAEKVVEKVLEKRVEVKVDNPAHLSRISILESYLEALPMLRAKIALLEANQPVDRIVEKEKIVEKRVEVKVQDNTALSILEQEIANWRMRYQNLETRMAEQAREAGIVKIIGSHHPDHNRPLA